MRTKKISASQAFQIIRQRGNDGGFVAGNKLAKTCFDGMAPIVAERRAAAAKRREVEAKARAKERHEAQKREAAAWARWTS